MKKTMRIISLVLCLSFVFGGVLFAQGSKKDGIHKTNYSSGELRYESTYRNGKLNGLTKEYSKDGTLITKYEFKDGMALKKTDLRGDSRDYGAFAFLMSWKFWLILVVVLGVLWFLFAKIFFVKRPF